MKKITNNYSQVNHTIKIKQYDSFKQEKFKMNYLYVITGPAVVGKSTISYEIGRRLEKLFDKNN